jgi:AAA15 family ATPase/GTPase
MRFLGVSVKSFGSFGDTAALDFEPGINLIVGQNNVGKSAYFALLILATLPTIVIETSIHFGKSD